MHPRDDVCFCLPPFNSVTYIGGCAFLANGRTTSSNTNDSNDRSDAIQRAPKRRRLFPKTNRPWRRDEFLTARNGPMLRNLRATREAKLPFFPYLMEMAQSLSRLPAFEVRKLRGLINTILVALVLLRYVTHTHSIIAFLTISFFSADGQRCAKTLVDLFAKAKDPDKIVVGIVDQSFEEDDLCLESYCKEMGKLHYVELRRKTFIDAFECHRISSRVTLFCTILYY